MEAARICTYHGFLYQSGAGLRTRIKICGITRSEDARDAADLGADAIGLVFYPPSPRNLVPERARAIVDSVPPFVSVVGLFVNPSREHVESVLRCCPLGLLQFHGDETPDFCAGFGVPYIKAARVRPDADLVQYMTPYRAAQGWLLDAYNDKLYGGTGESFDWALIPAGLTRPVVLSGGLSPDNVTAAIRQCRPWAVDVSSGVEATKGIKDAAKIAAFIAGVKNADV